MLEVDVESRRVVQVRGFANRAPTVDEMAILAIRAGEHGVAYDPRRA